MKLAHLLIFSVLMPTAAAAADTPYGYNQDENGRSYQTRFDLRNRWYWGGGAAFDADTVTGNLQTGAVVEAFSDWDFTLDRHAFLEGDLQLSTLEFDAQLYRWDRSRRTEEPPVWITTFIGEPKRIDVPLHLGPSIVVGRLARREADDQTLTRLDAAELGMHWSFAQSKTLEDFVRIRVAAAGGVNFRGSEDVFGYVAPSASFEARWSPSDRGLWQFNFDATARRGFEPVGTNWTSLSALLEVERVLFAINDQPLTVFVQGRAEAFDNVDDRRFWGLVGARINFFVPPPLPPDRCPDEPEDYDGFQDDDGCPDPDNDHDGILDERDQCPFQAGPSYRTGCPVDSSPLDPDPCVQSPDSPECLTLEVRCRLYPHIPECQAPVEVPQTEVNPAVCDPTDEGCLNEE